MDCDAQAASCAGRVREIRSLAEEFLVENEIGDGTYARVFAAKELESGKPRAIKVVDREEVRSKPAHDGQELSVLATVAHPNIVRLHDVVETSNNELCFVFDHHETDLFNLLSRKRRLPEESVRQIAVALLGGLSYLHALDVAHRDLKLENVLVDASNSPPTVKLADFGYARFLSDGANQPVGTSFYQSPEVLMALERRGRMTASDAKAADLFALGVVLFYLLCGRPPYIGASWPVAARHKLYAAQRSPPTPADPRFSACTSLACREFVCSLLAFSAADRPKAADCYKDPWIASHLQDACAASAPQAAGSVPSSPLVPCPA